MRTRLARELSQRGLSQSEIAQKMSVTQAAVSKYLSQPRAESASIDEVSSLVGELTEMVLSSESSAAEKIRAICSTCMLLRIGSHTCESHKNQFKELKEIDCQICAELLGGTEPRFSGRARVIGDMATAVRVIEKIPRFDLIMPQVRANIVACDKTAKSIDDVAGVPGRITMVGGRARVLSGPQFGTSAHTAELLLWAKSSWPRVRACLCVSGNENVVQAADSNGFKVLRLKSPAVDPRRISSAATRLVKAQKRVPRLPALHVPGGVGVEPILYLFGKDAISLANQCVGLIEAL
ncbi:MAG: thiamine-phosphate synthase family protein [Candidatus Thorarchaeota archaeon]